MSAANAPIDSELLNAEPGTLAAVSQVDDHLFKKPLPIEEVKSKVPFASPGYEVTHKLEGHQSHVTALKFSGQGDHLVSGSNDCMLKLWNVATGQLENTLERGHSLGINALTWSPDSNFIVSCSDDKTIKLWSPHMGSCLRTLEGH